MRNWLGQEILVGSTVGRGMRSGNTSLFTIGIVTELAPDKLKVRVAWKYESADTWQLKEVGKLADGTPRFSRTVIGYRPSSGYATDGKGSLCTVESLFVLSDGLIEQAEKLETLGRDIMRSQQGGGFRVDQVAWEDLVEEVIT